jgi:histidine triad (HIT) family protein
MCIFCKIVAGEIPSNKILENDDFFAFYDINPVAKVHALVIPKKHIESFNEVDTNTMAGLTTFAQEVASKLGVTDSGYRLITNINDDGGQEVKHLHFHILGGEKLKPLNG